MKLGIGIIGCGLIGIKRAQAFKKHFRLEIVTDTDPTKARQLADKYGCQVAENSRELLLNSRIQAVVIATVHSSLASLTLQAIRSGKHVLVEKPGARNLTELSAVIAVAKKLDVRVRVGYNHRFHRAFRQAKKIVDAGKLGKLMMIRARYGHGGRVGYHREWRANPKLSGGGELIDQGVHLIDLARWFLGDFKRVDGFAQTLFWNMPVDDNAFLLLRTKAGQTASLHASCTEWKNIFSFEIYGQKGKLHLEGLGGSYGLEKLSWFRMLPEMGPPESTIWEYPQKDDSWEVEMEEFAKDIQLRRKPCPGLEDAYQALKVVKTVYQKRT